MHMSSYQQEIKKVITEHNNCPYDIGCTRQQFEMTQIKVLKNYKYIRSHKLIGHIKANIIFDAHSHTHTYTHTHTHTHTHTLTHTHTHISITRKCLHIKTKQTRRHQHSLTRAALNNNYMIHLLKKRIKIGTCGASPRQLDGLNTKGFLSTANGLASSADTGFNRITSLSL